MSFSDAMSSPDNTPETLISVPDDLEAAMIVSTLAAHDVDATTSGEFTAGFRAEAPGDVKVLVRSCDLAKAQQVLNDLRAQKPRYEEVASRAGLNIGTMLKLLLIVLLLAGFLQSCG